MTQAELASKADISKTTVNLILNGKYNPSLELMSKISDILSSFHVLNRRIGNRFLSSKRTAKRKRGRHSDCQQNQSVSDSKMA